MRLLFSILIFILIIASTSLAGGYKITKVVEVGPAARIPFYGPLKWSPNGTLLAYFVHNNLMISDTLGNPQAVAEIEMVPRRYEWISDYEVAITFIDRSAGDVATYELTVIDINDGKRRVVEDYKRQQPPTKSGDISIDGPFLTIEREAYYIRQTYTGQLVDVPLGRVKESIDEVFLFHPEKGANSHILRWGEDGLYKILIDETDSGLVGNRPPALTAIPSGMSFDSKLICYNNGAVIRLEDGTPILIHTFAGESPENTLGCKPFLPSFHPDAPELLFMFICEGTHPSGKEFVLERAGTFDYITNEFTILDTLLGITGCTDPIYAPDGRRIALRADGQVYIIQREGL